MQFVVPGMAVPYPEDIVLVWLQTGEGGALKVIHQAFFLLRRDPVIMTPGTDTGAEFPFSGLGVNQGSGQFRVAAQNLRRPFGAAGVVQPQKIIDRAIAAALSVREDFYVHGAVPPMALSSSRSWSRHNRISIVSA